MILLKVIKIMQAPIKIVILLCALLLSISCAAPTHNFLSLDNMNMNQLSGIMSGDWKSQLTGLLKQKVSSFVLPSHQSEEHVLRRHFTKIQAEHNFFRHRLNQ